MNLNSQLEQPQNAFAGIYAGKRVLITGHTGFKGSWLCEWLLALGAEVTGFALPPPTTPALFDQLGLASRLRHVVGDVRDLAAVRRVVDETKPDFVFHLAAQPLVRLSYDQPVETYATNVMGTVNVLEALRLYQKEFKGLSVESLKGSESATVQPFNRSAVQPQPTRVVAAVMVTTDKCYENKEWVHSYREEDPMGGCDPYSSSKGAAELVISAYRRSYFSPSTVQPLNDSTPLIRLASVRAGNVIGGGDWALDRIVPDCIRALKRGESIPVRNKIATRPWQHVLEPLSGYLWLGACLAGAPCGPGSAGSKVEKLKGPEATTPQSFNPSTLQLLHPSTVHPALCSAFNFGPALSSNRTVAELVQKILQHWPGRWEDRSDPNAVHEAKLLNLTTDKTFHFLGWSAVWNFETTISETVDWYREISTGKTSAPTVTQRQIAAYVQSARLRDLRWTLEKQSSHPS